MKTATVTEKALKASYLTSLRIAKSKKANTIGEELLQPARRYIFYFQEHGSITDCYFPSLYLPFCLLQLD